MTPPRTPRFWYDTTRPAARTLGASLAPLSVLYDLGRRAALSLSPPPAAAGVPVLCVGNLTAGGSGKTPLALTLHDLLREDHPALATFFLTRGYGGAQSGPLRVDPARHDFRAVGDEALLLARRAPTIVARDRVAGAALARENGTGLLILDDGFQSRALAKDLQILVIDGAAGLGNGRLLPAGPLREPPASAFARADAVVIVGPDARGVRTLLPAGKPVFEAFVKPVRALDPARRWVAFAGLGRPEKFRETLEDMGLRPLQFVPFPDHHPYTDRDREALERLAADLDARLLTTEKDALRLPSAFATRVKTLPIALEIVDREGLKAFLRARLSKDGRQS